VRLAVVSPFLDRRHGTELCIVEQIERLASQFDWEIHLYSQRVEDVNHVIESSGTPGASVGSILWHKVSKIRGPHIVQFLWWFAANQLRRWRDRRSAERGHDLTYSPGVNCLDADAIVVHIVFHELYARVCSELHLRKLPFHSWPRSIHRKLYYHLIMALENKIYRKPQVRLAAVSQHVADHLRKHFQRADVAVIPNGVDTSRFCPEARFTRRHLARQSFGFTDADFVLLLIGNDWKNKGLDVLLEAMALVQDLPFRLLVVGRDNPGLYASVLRKHRMQDRVLLFPNSADVLSFYAAADAYVGPSLEDAFGLPILEAMACSLPVIASVHAGASEAIEDGQSGLLLHHPECAYELSALLLRLFHDGNLQQKLGLGGAQTAARYNWEANTAKTEIFLNGAIRNRHSS
jgi:glycosyltransferase involved in cell wall biosynthesis